MMIDMRLFYTISIEAIAIPAQALVHLTIYYIIIAQIKTEESSIYHYFPLTSTPKANRAFHLSRHFTDKVELGLGLRL